MTQIELEKLIRDLHQEKIDTKAKLNAELAEIEERRTEARKVLDDCQIRYKDICREIEQKQRELQEVNIHYYQRKQALLQAFPEAIGTQVEGNCRKRNEYYALRAKMIANLKEDFKDTPGIDVENINVHFTVEGENVTFSIVIPKSNGTEE